MTTRPGRNFGGGPQFGGDPTPATPPAGPVRPVQPDEDPIAQLVRPPVARVTQPDPVRVRPELEGDVARFTALGLAYQPQLSQAHARVVATRLAEWSYEDPELRALIEDDFLNAVTSAGDSWWTRGDSVTETLWHEAVRMVEAVAGSEHAAQRRRILDDRDMAAVTGATDPVERLREKPPQEKEGWALTTARAVLGGVLQGVPGVGIGVGLIRQGQEVQARSLEEAQREIVAVAEAEVEELVTPELVTAQMAQRLLEDGEVQTLSAGVNLADSILGSLSDDERTRLISDVRSMTTQELVEQWTPPPTGETGVDTALRTMLTGALDLAQMWDAVAQTLAVGILEPLTFGFGDPERGGITRGGPGSALIGGVLSGDLAEGFEAFKRDFDALKEGGIASYYGLDPNSAAGGWLNLGSSILFDPTTWVTMGGAQAARRGMWMMSTPEGVEAYLRSPIGVDLVRTAASTTDPLKLTPVTQGMSSSARRTILDATDPNVIEDVIRNEATNGFWVANGPALAAYQQSIVKAADIARNLGGPRVARTLQRMVARLPANRSVRLGEASFLDDATELVVARFPNDPDRATEALRGLYDRWDDYARGSENLLNERTLFADQLRAESTRVARSVTAEVRGIPRARAALNDVNVRLRQLDTEAAALQRQMDEAVPIGDDFVEPIADLPARLSDLDREFTALNNQRESLELWVNRFGTRYDEWHAARADLLKQRQLLRRANLEASKPKSRATLAQWVDDFMDEWATDVGVPRDPNGRPLWEEVTGGRRGRGGVSESASRTAPFGEEEETARLLGIGEGGSHHWLPATPYEMVMYQAAREAGNLPVLRQIMSGARKIELGRKLDSINSVWATNLLLNPVTPVKAHIEDVYKFVRVGGPMSQAGRALVSPLKSAAHKIGADRVARVLPGIGADNPHSAQFVRQTIGGLEQRRSAWQTVARDETGHFEAARRWLEGTFLQDDAIRVWARSVEANDPAIWNQWWDEVGKLRVRAPVVSLPGTGGQVRALDADTAFRSMESSMEAFANLSSNPAEFRAALTRLAAKGERRVPAAIARMAGPVPTERIARAGPLDIRSHGFDLAFGAPARARGGVFFEHFHDQALDVLEQRWAGRIIDDQLDVLVQKGFAGSLEEAQWLLAIRNPQVDDMLRQMGLTTRAFLEETASTWAEKHARSIMYLGGASSLGEGLLSKVAPFVPAQFDFLTFWTRQLFSGTELAVSGPAEAASRRLGEVLQRHGLEEVGGKLTRVGMHSKAVPIPINARVASRWMQLAAQSSQTDRENRSAAHPISLISNWTFLPVDFSDTDNFLVDFLPGLGPIPTWLAKMSPWPDEVDDTLESLFPSLTWTDADWTEVHKILLPATTKSLTGMIGWMGRGIASNVEGGNQALSNLLVSPVFDWQRRAYGEADFFKVNIGNMLAENPDVVVGSDEYLSMVAEASRQATAEANGGEARDRAQAYFGIPVDYGADGQVLLHYGGLVSELDRLSEAGVVGSAQRDQLKDLWGRVESGEASREERTLFGQVASSLLFDGLPDDQRDIVIALHPELAVNMVSTVRAVPNNDGTFDAPEGVVRPDGRLDTTSPLLQGQKGADLRRQGFEEGWLEPRPDHEVAADVFYIYQRARWNTLKALWEASTGRPYSDGMTKQLERTVFTFPPEAAATFDRLGVAVPTQMTGAEFRETLGAAYAQRSEAQKAAESANNSGPDANPFWTKIQTAPDYQPLWQEVEAVRDRLDDRDIGIASMWEWPEATKAALRERIAATVATDPAMLRDYNRFMRPALGPLDWEPPQPPPVSELEKAIETEARFVSVEDGDTIRLATADGDIRVRIIGLNAPEQGQVGYSDAWDRLNDIIEGAGTVTVGRYRSDLFPTVQNVDVGEQRIFGWLYVDGVPLYDPAVFTATNQAGAETGGNVTDLAARLAAERQRMAGETGSGG